MTHYPEIRLKKSQKKYDWYEVIEDCLCSDIVITKGFTTDFASVPQAFWALIPPHGLAAMPSVVHDYIYQHRNDVLSRREADTIWLQLMKQASVPRWQRYTMYAYVRLLGWRNWQRFKRNS